MVALITKYNVYTLSHSIPSTATYRHLCRSGGLSDKSPSACAIGLPRSVFCVQILAASCMPGTDVTSTEFPEPDSIEEQPDPRVVGMGRIIGDGTLFLQIVDIVLLPAHQHLGLGKFIMWELMLWIEAPCPRVAGRLYERFGFGFTEASGSRGMAYTVRGKGKE
ncbi:hypothetical protein DACRYDRAFT_106212 [Dacryopinax primogenitus]|uniref:Uncharacterized protein n=1 Tax=Dacryopinax primogenitus (strain DJM 731) TaxID=1858805 RepID=M5G2W1_DACPD|nr:uncharacterized protein DACRYDRAFT_106212 [Dacryopinax primogenitus]EJU03034.1 hypothetical protein DACRYDRAFT_106212 [Dacryopinax primogenitus]